MLDLSHEEIWFIPKIAFVSDRDSKIICGFKNCAVKIFPARVGFGFEKKIIFFRFGSGFGLKKFFFRDRVGFRVLKTFFESGSGWKFYSGIYFDHYWSKLKWLLSYKIILKKCYPRNLPSFWAHFQRNYPVILTHIRFKVQFLVQFPAFLM